jgi:hypothetical protein
VTSDHASCDAGKGHDHLQDASDEDGSGRARADDVVRIMHRTVESKGRDRDKGEQVEQARDERGLPQRGRREWSCCCGWSVVMSFSCLEWAVPLPPL